MRALFVATPGGRKRKDDSVRVDVNMFLAACLSGLLLGATRPFSQNVVVRTATAHGIHHSHAFGLVLASRAHYWLWYNAQVLLTVNQICACTGCVEEEVTAEEAGDDGVAHVDYFRIRR